MRVVVVGGGMAGLTAADAARNAGAEAVVVESRDRIGGRIHTAAIGSGVVDLGASWVHGPAGNPVSEALATAGLKARNDGPYYSRMAVWCDGWLDATDATTLAAVGGDWDPEEAIEALSGGDRFPDGVEWYVANRELEGTGAELARFGLMWIAAPLVAAGPPEQISLAGLAGYAEGGGGNLVVAGGYVTLLERLAAGLDVRLGVRATAVEHGGEGVVVHTTDGPIEGDRAIVTVPLGVLKAGTLEFDPPLPPAHAAAIERLAMGTLEKIAFRFAEPFWPESAWQITHVADDHSFPVWFDFSRHSGSPTLVALYNPAVTPGLAELAGEERVGPALEVLRKMFGSVPEPEETLATDWRADPDSRGSYSYVPVGSEIGDLAQLAQPLSERLALAGEASVPASYGTVHAAFSSGLRAAGQVLGERPARLTIGVVPPHWVEAAS